MKIARTIRMQVLRGKSDQIRTLLLTKDQIKLVKYVARFKWVKAFVISEREGISVQNASGKLNRLYQAGYLQRYSMSAKSGGLEYIYFAQDFTDYEE